MLRSSLLRLFSIKVTTHNVLSYTDPTKGNLRLRISENAMKKLKDLYTKEKNKAVQVQVNFGGCHGFQYDFKYEKIPKIDANTKIVDTKQQLLLLKHQGIPLLLDVTTWDMIQDSLLDYEEELIGSKFVIKENPKADQGCGCGVSFALKDV